MAEYDLVGIGNALVDVAAHVEDEFLRANGLAKGSMSLVDAAQSQALYDRMPPGTESSGGSCGNTMAGFASLGGSGAYIGKVKDDQLGAVFRHDLRSIGVDFDTPAADGATDGAATGSCLVLVTPDAERTMCTYLGAASELSPGDVEADVIERAEVVYMEGYLFDPPAAQRAFIHAADLAHAAGRKVAITLSDGFCVDRHRAAFRALVEDHTDILFANEDEILSLYQVDAFDAALQLARGHCEVACLTRSEKGSVILSGDEVHVIDAVKVERVVDTTGAGDQYAAGFLYGYTRGMDLAASGRIASIAAAEIVSHNGARPEADLAKLVAGAVA